MNLVIDLGEPPSKKTKCSTSYVIQCILCSKNDKWSNLRILLKQGRDRLRAKAAERIKLDIQKDRDLMDKVLEINLEDIPEDSEVLYHNKCYESVVNYRDDNSSTELESELESDRTVEVTATKLSRPVTRGLLTPWDKTLCIFCQKESSKETVLIMTIPVSEKIMEASKHDYIMRVRTAGIADLIAADALYHSVCCYKVCYTSCSHTHYIVMFRGLHYFLRDRYRHNLCQLETSHPDVHEEFMAGNFVVKTSKQNFNQLSTDQALKHVNKISKTVGGLVGIIREDSTRDRWCLTYNHRSQVSESTYEMFGICDLDREYTVWEAKESNPARLNRDEQDVKNIMNQLDRFNAFKQVLPELTTMDVAPDEISTSLLTAPARGNEQIDDFVCNRLMQHPAKFHDPVKQNRSRTLSSIYEVTLQTHIGEKTKTIKAGRELFQTLFC